MNKEKWLHAGFAISTDSQSRIEENAREKNIELTDAVWEQINKDSSTIERNIIKYLKSQEILCRDEGHDKDDDLIGSCWTKVSNQKGCDLIRNHSQEETEYLEAHEIDTAYTDVSEIGTQIMDGQVQFFAIKEKAED